VTTPQDLAIAEFILTTRGFWGGREWGVGNGEWGRQGEKNY
jgi:hypothetical protein